MRPRSEWYLWYVRLEVRKAYYLFSILDYLRESRMRLWVGL